MPTFVISYCNNYSWEPGMFVVELTYKKSLDDIDKHLEAHRAYLDDGYRNNYFLVSGPKNPRTGGVIISQLKDRQQLENILKQDPFHIYDVADYKIIEFSGTKYHPNFSSFIEKP
jgi:uncharacterized protein YciI